MRNLIPILSLLLVLQMLGSCRKFIAAPQPTTTLITAQVFADSADANAGIVGIYLNMWNRGSATFGSGLIDLYAGISSDEMSPAAKAGSIEQIYQNSIITSNSYLDQMWSNAYAYIYQANASIAGLAASPLAVSVKNRLTGEAKFLRAYLTFELVNLYGSVPLVDTTDYTKTSVLARSSVDSIYAQIFTDLNNAYTLMENDQAPNDYTRANLYSVSALLARVSLYQQRWADAEKYASVVINSGNYTLANDLDNVFLNGNSEAIWQLPAAYPGYEVSIASQIIPLYPGAIPEYFATPQVMAAFETGDQRFSHWIDSVRVNNLTYYYPYKYKLGNDNMTTPAEAYTILRLAEQYLIRAEAKAEQGTDLTGAIADLNSIRARAGLAPTTATSQADVLIAIQHERQVELCFECGHRWFDLKRTNTINAVLGAPGNVKPGWQPDAALWPIPFQETQLDLNLTQNPGYN